MHTVHVGVAVKPTLKINFEDFHLSYGDTIDRVITPIFDKVGSTRLKEYLEIVYPGIDTTLEAGKEVILLSQIVRKKCAFPGIGLLQKLADRFAEDLPDVKQSLAKLVKQRQKLYTNCSVKKFLAEIKKKQKKSCAKVNYVKINPTGTSKTLSAMC